MKKYISDTLSNNGFSIDRNTKTIFKEVWRSKNHI